MFYEYILEIHRLLDSKEYFEMENRIYYELGIGTKEISVKELVSVSLL